MNLTEGILRARYRDSWEQPSPMVPGEVYAITIELFPRSIYLRQVIGCVSISQAATSRISTSTRTQESPKA
jgi:predicted acyl esterase